MARGSVCRPPDAPCLRALTHQSPSPRPGSAERGPSARDASDGTRLGRGHLSSGKTRTRNGGRDLTATTLAPPSFLWAEVAARPLPDNQ